jgi:hypothetical protein
VKDLSGKKVIRDCLGVDRVIESVGTAVEVGNREMPVERLLGWLAMEPLLSSWEWAHDPLLFFGKEFVEKEI